MSHNSQYFSVIRAQWQHIGFSDVHKIRAEQANENARVEKNSAKENVIEREMAETD